VCFRDHLRLLVPTRTESQPDGALHNAIREELSRGACFWPDLVRATGTADEKILLGALWDLVWAGEVTNDTLAPLRARAWGRPKRGGGRDRTAKPRPGALRRAGPPAAAGRWSLVASLLDPPAPPPDRAPPP